MMERFAGVAGIVVPILLLALAIVVGRGILWWVSTAPLRRMRRLAAQGDPDGLTGMGIYLLDRGQPQRAADCFARAAEQGHAAAQGWLGLCYLRGAGVEPNPSRALECLRVSAAAGAAAGCLHLGNCYLEGNGVEQNAEEAVRLYEQAAAQDDDDACYALGMCCLQGIGTPANRDRAISLLRRAAYVLHAEATEKLDELGVSYKTIEDDSDAPEPKE